MISCASQDVTFLGKVASSLESRGHRVDIVGGAEHNDLALMSAVEQTQRRGLYVLCRSGELGRENIERLRASLRRCGVPFSRTLTVSLEGVAAAPRALEERVLTALRRLSPKSAVPPPAPKSDTTRAVVAPPPPQGPLLPGPTTSTPSGATLGTTVAAVPPPATPPPSPEAEEPAPEDDEDPDENQVTRAVQIPAELRTLAGLPQDFDDDDDDADAPDLAQRPESPPVRAPTGPRRTPVSAARPLPAPSTGPLTSLVDVAPTSFRDRATAFAAERWLPLSVVGAGVTLTVLVTVAVAGSAAPTATMPRIAAQSTAPSPPVAPAPTVAPAPRTPPAAAAAPAEPASPSAMPSPPTTAAVPTAAGGPVVRSGLALDAPAVLAALDARAIRAMDALIVSMPSPQKVSFDEAVAHCEALDVVGLRGWRLPTIEELEGLGAHRVLGSASAVWSADPSPSDPGARMVLKARELTTAEYPVSERSIHAVCVRPRN